MRIGRLLASLFVFAALAGCHIENHESDDSQEGQSLCSSFCDRLQLCGSISPSQYSSCTSQCVARFDGKRHDGHDDDDDDDDHDNPQEKATRDGCACVILDVCRPVNEYNCPGAPLPPAPPGGGQGGSSSGQGGSAQAGTSSGGHTTAGSGGSAQAGSGGSSAGGSGPGYVCSIDNDCASNEDCLDGTCRARCKASCQCHTGEVCDAGHCVPPVAPPPACSTDCDCPAGQACLSGACK